MSSAERVKGPRKPDPPQSDGEQERKSTILPVPLSITLLPSPAMFLLALPHGGIFSLFARSFHFPFPPWSLPLAPPARHDDDEEENHDGNPSADGKRQQ